MVDPQVVLIFAKHRERNLAPPQQFVVANKIRSLAEQAKLGGYKLHVIHEHIVCLPITEESVKMFDRIKTDSHAQAIFRKYCFHQNQSERRHYRRLDLGTMEKSLEDLLPVDRTIAEINRMHAGLILNYMTRYLPEDALLGNECWALIEKANSKDIETAIQIAIEAAIKLALSIRGRDNTVYQQVSHVASNNPNDQVVVTMGSNHGIILSAKFVGTDHSFQVEDIPSPCDFHNDCVKALLKDDCLTGEQLRSFIKKHMFYSRYLYQVKELKRGDVPSDDLLLEAKAYAEKHVSELLFSG